MDVKYKKFGKYFGRETKRKMSLVDLAINGNVGTMDLTEIEYRLWTRFIEGKAGFFCRNFVKAAIKFQIP
jgi:hypothetical protein